MLKLGLQTPVRVTINNVRTPAQLAGKLARQIEADSATIVGALTDPATARKAGFDSVTLFSMFIPDTYEFYWTVSPAQFIERMRREYDRFWTPQRDAKRQRSGLSRLEVMTLASIVYEETRQSDEMPRIAGVYINRLRKGWPLQARPTTVKYALQEFGLRRILHRHLKYPSPYNTYKQRSAAVADLYAGTQRHRRRTRFRTTRLHVLLRTPRSTATTTSHARSANTTPTPAPIRPS